MNDEYYLQELCARFDSGQSLSYVFFWGHQRSKQGVSAACFSQWYDAPFVVEGVNYPTAEHYMMAEKAALFGDEETRALVWAASSPAAAKALGRQVRGFDETVWLAHRFSIVTRANRAKFAQNPELAAFLSQTGDQVLVEASPVDAVWGIGLARDDVRVHNPHSWRGLNLLGFSLMHVRAALRLSALC